MSGKLEFRKFSGLKNVILIFQYNDIIIYVSFVLFVHFICPQHI